MATVDDLMTLATFAGSGFFLLVGHHLADHVTGRCDWQAAKKGAPTPEEVAAGASPRRGWRANLAHVGQYHLTLLALGFLVWLVLPLNWSPAGVVAALAWSAGTHALQEEGTTPLTRHRHAHAARTRRTGRGARRVATASPQVSHIRCFRGR
ncbi:hypothetical protein [Streptomyces sp. NPDC054765]